MRRLILICAILFGLNQSVLAQEEDGGFISNRLEASLSGEGRTVKITGFEGALSSTATMEKLTVADSEGVWLILEGATLNWRRAALLRGRVEVNELSAERIEVLRKPIAQPSSLPSAEATGFSLPDLPVSLNIAHVSVAEAILDKDVLGFPLGLSLVASATLEEGSGHTKLIALRTDGGIGTFSLSGTYVAQSQALDIELDFQEGEDGVFANLLNVPDRPALEASIIGHGPLSDFKADFFLASDGVNRIQGEAILKQEPFSGSASSSEPEMAQHFNLVLGGDVTALFAPKYHDFFGSDLLLKVDGFKEPKGAIELESFEIKAQTVDLEGSFRLNDEFWPVQIDVNGAVKSVDGAPVLLPVSGGETYVDALILSLAYDQRTGTGWTGDVDLTGYVQEGLEIGEARLAADGNFSNEGEEITGVDADITFDTQGLVLADPNVSEALGSDITGSAHVEYAPDNVLSIHNVLVDGLGVSFSGDFDIGDFSQGLPTQLKAALKVEDIERFSALVKRKIAGGADVSVTGSITPLAGKFDLQVQGTTQDLALGIPQVDPIIAGNGQIFLDAARDETGATLRRLNLTTSELSAVADAKISKDTISFNYDLSLKDLGVILPDYPGEVTAKGVATQSAQGVRVDTDIEGPLGSSAKIGGFITGPNAKLDVKAHLASFGVIVPELPGSADVNGTISRKGDDWHVDGDITGSVGVSVAFDGLIQSSRDLDLSISGHAPLGLATPFIEPQSLQGDTQFDLTLKGKPTLQGLAGTITVSNGKFSSPELQAGLQDIGANITLNGTRANIDGSAKVNSGGSVDVTGDLNLTTGFEGHLAIDLNGVKLVDPALFATQIDGNVTIDGPLTGGALIAGEIRIGETLISVPSGGVASTTDIPPMDHIAPSLGVRVTLERAGLAETASEEKALQSAGPTYGLNLTISAPHQIFVRGRGIDAELGGDLTLTGTTKNVQSTGSFELRRGRISLLEKRFDLTTGQILLEGSFDPRLYLVATTVIPNGTASIIVEGLLSDPEIIFESSPPVPEDEVLALIFFGTSVDDLSPFQAVQLASAVSTLAGKGSGFLSEIRDAIPIDDFDLEADEDGVATVRIGKRLSDNVYSDLAVNAHGETEISLNLDVTSKLTVKGTTTNEGNSSIGLFFDTDY